MVTTQDFNHVNLTVTIEEENPDNYDLVDEVYVPIAMNGFSESEQYVGIHGIATITLGYSFIIISNHGNSDTIQEGEKGFNYYVKYLKNVHLC